MGIAFAFPLASFFKYFNGSGGPFVGMLESSAVPRGVPRKSQGGSGAAASRHSPFRSAPVGLSMARIISGFLLLLCLAVIVRSQTGCQYVLLLWLRYDGQFLF